MNRRSRFLKSSPLHNAEDEEENDEEGDKEDDEEDYEEIEGLGLK